MISRLGILNKISYAKEVPARPLKQTYSSYEVANQRVWLEQLLGETKDPEEHRSAGFQGTCRDFKISMLDWWFFLIDGQSLGVFVAGLEVLKALKGLWCPMCQQH